MAGIPDHRACCQKADVLLLVSRCAREARTPSRRVVRGVVKVGRLTSIHATHIFRRYLGVSESEIDIYVGEHGCVYML